MNDMCCVEGWKHLMFAFGLPCVFFGSGGCLTIPAEVETENIVEEGHGDYEHCNYSKTSVKNGEAITANGILYTLTQTGATSL